MMRRQRCLRSLCQRRPPLRKLSREKHLTLLRRLLRDASDRGYLIPPNLIRGEDFPLRDHYLPRPLPPDEDLRLQQQLQQTDTLEGNALRLIRATRIRVGECSTFLWIASSRSVNSKRRIRVPLGKLHAER